MIIRLEGNDGDERTGPAVEDNAVYCNSLERRAQHKSNHKEWGFKGSGPPKKQVCSNSMYQPILMRRLRI